MSNSATKLEYGSIIVFVRDWVAGKALLTSRDEDVKAVWRKMAMLHPNALEMLVDPDDLSEEDLEGPVSVIVDPQLVDIRINPANRGLTFYVTEEAEDE